jgi:hypothetical protein
MDAARFDALTRIFTGTGTGTRRRDLGGLLLGSLGLLGWQSAEDTDAHDLSKKCKKKSGEAKKKCLKKAKKHDAQHAAETQPPPPPPPRPHVCAGRDFCTTPGEENLCQTRDQECECAVTADGAPFCGATRPRPALRLVTTCGDCPLGETCIDLGACEAPPTPFGCVLPCPNRPTCNDELQNGTESDVDCGGGSCLRCADNKKCATRHDCASALCFSGTCQGCSATRPCGVDSDGSLCSCALSSRSETSLACVKTSAAPVGVSSCTQCPNDAACVPNTSNGSLRCIKLCGAP